MSLQPISDLLHSPVVHCQREAQSDKHEKRHTNTNINITNGPPLRNSVAAMCNINNTWWWIWMQIYNRRCKCWLNLFSNRILGLKFNYDRKLKAPPVCEWGGGLSTWPLNNAHILKLLTRSFSIANHIEWNMALDSGIIIANKSHFKIEKNKMV